MRIISGHVPAMELLIENGADVNLRDRFGDTSLISAVRSRKIRFCIAFIIAFSSNLDRL